MEKQIGIEYIIHSALAIQYPHMFLQFFTVDKRGFDLIHHFLFFFCQCIRVFGIYRRKIHIIHHILFSLNLDSSFLKVYFIQQQAIFHMELRMSFDDLRFHLPLQNRNGFMHFGN